MIDSTDHGKTKKLLISTCSCSVVKEGGEERRVIRRQTVCKHQVNVYHSVKLSKQFNLIWKSSWRQFKRQQMQQRPWVKVVRGGRGGWSQFTDGGRHGGVTAVILDGDLLPRGGGGLDPPTDNLEASQDFSLNDLNCDEMSSRMFPSLDNSQGQLVWFFQKLLSVLNTRWFEENQLYKTVMMMISGESISPLLQF